MAFGFLAKMGKNFLQNKIKDKVGETKDKFSKLGDMFTNPSQSAAGAAPGATMTPAGPVMPGAAPGAGMQGTLPSGMFGSSKEGQKAAGFLPDFLQSAAGAGGGMGDFFAQAFKNLMDPRGLNAQLSNMAQGTAGRARKARTASKFKGSPVGEALAGGIETGGAALAQQARIQDQAQKMRTGMGLTQAFTGAVTNPLMSTLGMSLGNDQAKAALAEQARQFSQSQPSDLEKAMGFAGSIFCWSARATLQDDRWLAARQFLLNDAPQYLHDLYWHHGEALAEKIKTNPELRDELLPVFEEFARRGQKYLD